MFSRIKLLERKFYLKGKKKKLHNTNPTVIASNCNGAVILHDLGCRFNSPTVNLYFDAKDFIKLLSNPTKYFEEELIEISSEEIFPVGMLGDVKVYFMHYKNFDEAKKKWDERKERINYDNMFVMMTDKNGCTEEDIKTFDELPYKNKVIFTHKEYPKYKSAYYMKGFEREGEVGILSDWKPGKFLFRRYLDNFDYVSFLNGR